MVITMNITTKELYETAKGLAKSRQLNEYTSAGAVSAALLTDQGNVYTGICIDAPCGRCREFLYQLNHDNLDCIVVLESREVQLKELLPELWS